MTLKERITEDMKAAMRAKETARLSTIRLLLAAIKQREVDERIQLSDADVVAAIEKMLKQRRDSISQYDAAGRNDLSRIERDEMAIIEHYLPAKMGEAEVVDAIDVAIRETGAGTPADIGKLMAVLKPRLAGRADMGDVSKFVRQRLSGA